MTDQGLLYTKTTTQQILDEYQINNVTDAEEVLVEISSCIEELAHKLIATVIEQKRVTKAIRKHFNLVPPE